MLFLYWEVLNLDMASINAVELITVDRVTAITGKYYSPSLLCGEASWVGKGLEISAKRISSLELGRYFEYG